MSYLDIIVPHCREPWATGKKFFDMLALQRGVDFDEIRVILAQDGEEGRLPFIKYLRYPFQITEKVIPHGGVSAARNAGIDLSGAVWVAFCDFDDMYSSALSLKVALEALRKADKDGKVYLWNRFMEEGEDAETGAYLLYKHTWDMTFIHGRFFRRDFLNDNGLRFNPALSFGEDADFNTLCQIIAGPERVGEIREPIYLWCTNSDSVTRREKDKSVFYAQMLEHRFATAEELERRGIEKEHTGAVVRTALDCYYELTSGKATEHMKRCEGQFAAWWGKNRAVFMGAPSGMLASIMENVRSTAVKSGACTAETITLGDWLRAIETKYDIH